MHSTELVSQLGHCGNHYIPVLTPETPQDVIIPVHQVKRNFVLLGFSLGGTRKVEGDHDLQGERLST
jgi:hypothetical protein